MWYHGPRLSRIDRILILTSCNFFSGGLSPKNYEVKRAWHAHVSALDTLTCAKRGSSWLPKGLFFNTIDRILIPTSCNSFSESSCPKNSKVKRAARGNTPEPGVVGVLQQLRSHDGIYLHTLLASWPMWVLHSSSGSHDWDQSWRYFVRRAICLLYASMGFTRPLWKSLPRWSIFGEVGMVGLWRRHDDDAYRQPRRRPSCFSGVYVCAGA
jgi:hypothetical protein